MTRLFLFGLWLLVLAMAPSTLWGAERAKAAPRRKPASEGKLEQSLSSHPKSPWSFTGSLSVGAFASEPPKVDWTPNYTIAAGAAAEIRYRFLALSFGYTRSAASVDLASPATAFDAMLAQSGDKETAAFDSTVLTTTLWAQHPLSVGPVAFTPRVGLGLDSSSLKVSVIETRATSETGHVNFEKNTQSVMAYFGLELPEIWGVTLSGDYGFSLTSNPIVTTDFSIPGSPMAINLPPGPGSLTQLRLSALIRLTPSLQLGPVFMLRTTSTANAAPLMNAFQMNPNPIDPPLTSFSAQLSYRL